MEKNAGDLSKKRKRVGTNIVVEKHKISKLHKKQRQNGLPFIQNVACYVLHKEFAQIVDGLTMCFACYDAVKNQQFNTVDCQFFAFRRLRYLINGKLCCAGVLDPYIDPKPEDINIWYPDEETEPNLASLSIEASRTILSHIGDLFCRIWHKEMKVFDMYEHSLKFVAWKKCIPGVREICDICDTTIFNYHWICAKCSYSVCIDCYVDRKKGKHLQQWHECASTKVAHKLSNMLLAQIIPGNALDKLARKMHELRNIWKIPHSCNCHVFKRVIPEDQKIAKDKVLDNLLLLKKTTNHNETCSKDLKKKHAKKWELAKSLGIKNYLIGEKYQPNKLSTGNEFSRSDKFEPYNSKKSSNFLKYSDKYNRVPHKWLCNGKLLHLIDPLCKRNKELFEHIWNIGLPVLVSDVDAMLNKKLWKPKVFARGVGDATHDLINCLTGDIVADVKLKDFWAGFRHIDLRLQDEQYQPMLLKLKDWPDSADFAQVLPIHFANFTKCLPLPDYTLNDGNMNLVSFLPKIFLPPDLGPKMYNAYGSPFNANKGTTNLHLDVSDAVNVMVFASSPDGIESCKLRKAIATAMVQGGCDQMLCKKLCGNIDTVGALWHIYEARDAQKIRDFISHIFGSDLDESNDPIHDQTLYLDYDMRKRLFAEYGVLGIGFVQSVGDAVFIPAGTPHQVLNLRDCIKIAEDFVSPQNVSYCYALTDEFRRLPKSHMNRADKLQIKNIIYHTIKDCCNVLFRALNEHFDEQLVSDIRKFCK